MANVHNNYSQVIDASSARPGVPPSSIPQYISHSRRSSRRSDILDDIKNDHDLLFGDDEVDESSPDEIYHPSPSAASSDNSMTFYPTRNQQQIRRLSALGSTVSSRRSSNTGTASRLISKISMENLQRQVDMALEFFTHENSDDDDELLENDHSRGLSFQFSDKPTLRFNSEESDSYPGTASTSLATSCDFDFSDCPSARIVDSIEQDHDRTPHRAGGGGGLSMKHRTKSILSLPLSLLPSKPLMNFLQEEDDAVKFDCVIGEELASLGISKEQFHDRNFSIDFNAIRRAMEPFLASARLQRDEARKCVLDTLDAVNQVAVSRRGSFGDGSLHIGSNYGVPYPDLRTETPFLYDVDSYPLDRLLADTLGVEDLSQIHIAHPRTEDKARLMAPLQNRGQRRAFHRCFDSFVTSHVIPLLHSQALSKEIFYTNRHQLRKGKPQRIVYRYQAFPTINIVRPGECSIGPHCDLTQGHSIGNISFHIPLTATFGTNAVYVESRPGREDWHPLSTKSPGLGFQFDGARCLHFNLRNETDITRVSLNFSIAITRASDFGEVEYDPDDQLCCPELLKDEFTVGKEGYYDEVVVSVGDIPRSFLPGPVAIKKPCSRNRLYDPDERLGFPFAV
ncbi:hypothetical protein HJC23_008506 [Cyclotella cryptica]|uniref:Uncharacterized protein n=1 Tax=Cyclotella cryptica TaxID=29204 RepID=A0ABD3QY47_9STRA|eukprot:CCRYP_001261-RB/>CCRYP_001261-RB protein AED:0.06 eAED:0.06 QI:394/1/1/1/0.8/0.5/6/4129/622